MTRILGIDIITGSHTNFQIAFAASLVDTLNQTHRLYDQLTTDQLLDLLLGQTIDLLAVDHVLELYHDQRIVEYLVDSTYPKIVQVSQSGQYGQSLVKIAQQKGITIKSKPGSVKSAIICSLLAQEHSTPIKIYRDGGTIKYRLDSPSTTTSESILSTRIKPGIPESTHRKTYRDLFGSAFVRSVDQVIGHGKEAIVYRVRDLYNRDTIVKSFRTYSSIAQTIHSQTYRATAGHIPLLMARDEARFLTLLAENDIPVPRLYFRDDTYVGMETVCNDSGQLSPTLAQVDPSEQDLTITEDLLYQSLDHLFQISDSAKMVHGDYSANNLLVRHGQLVVIDVSQAMQINTNTFVNTPKRLRLDQALDGIFRDLDGILTFFERKFRVKVERDHIFEQFLDLIPTIFADRVELITQMWSEKFR